MRLRQLPAKFHKQRMIIEMIANTFDQERIYHESEVNDHLSSIYDDYATLRRMLIDMRLMERTKDGNRYHICRR